VWHRPSTTRAHRHLRDGEERRNAAPRGHTLTGSRESGTRPTGATVPPDRSRAAPTNRQPRPAVANRRASARTTTGRHRPAAARGQRTRGLRSPRGDAARGTRARPSHGHLPARADGRSGQMPGTAPGSLTTGARFRRPGRATRSARRRPLTPTIHRQPGRSRRGHIAAWSGSGGAIADRAARSPAGTPERGGEDPMGRQVQRPGGARRPGRMRTPPKGGSGEVPRRAAAWRRAAAARRVGRRACPGDPPAACSRPQGDRGTPLVPPPAGDGLRGTDPSSTER
jgi:hypothetical protein